MPKIRDTRKQRAQALLERLQRGPCSLTSTEKSRHDYTLWVNTWILPEVKRLVPELREKKKVTLP